jgi:O-antigen ligase
MFGHFVAALAITWLMQHRRYFRRVLWSLVAIMCVQAVYAMTHQGRGHGDLLGDENDLAIACVIVFPIGFVGFQSLTGRWRWICGFATALLLGGIVSSFSRGGFVGLAAAAGYCVLLGRHRIRNLAIGGAAAALLFLLAPSGYSDEMASISETESGTAETRFFLWLAAARVWTDYPIFGVGPYNSSGYLGEYQPRNPIGSLFEGVEFRDRDWTGKAIHSLYFEVLADRGLVGIGLFAALTVLHFRTLRRLRRAAHRGLLPGADLRRETHLFSLSLEASMVGLLAAGAFLSVAAYPHFWFLTAQAVALDRWVRHERQRRVSRARAFGPGPDTVGGDAGFRSGMPTRSH